MSNLFSIIVTFFVFTVLVTIHELGHFIMAKKHGIMVKEFAIGMGPAIFSKQMGETIYSIRILPFGGYCAMLGEDDGDDPRSFVSKSVWQRFTVLVMGPMMNFILAFVLIFGLISTSFSRTTDVTGVVPDYPCAEAGIQAGDKILSIDGKKINIYFDLETALEGNGIDSTEVVVLRNGEKVKFEVTPKLNEEENRYMIGVYTQVKNGIFSKNVENVEKAGVLETAAESFHTMMFYIKSTIQGFVQLITFNVSKDEVIGPVGIVKVVEDSYEAGLEYSQTAAVRNIISLAVLLSANLGAINLFPIPALDGGRILFLIIEGIRRKPLNRELEGIAHFAAFALLMAFMVFVAFNDIIKLF